MSRNTKLGLRKTAQEQKARDAVYKTVSDSKQQCVGPSVAVSHARLPEGATYQHSVIDFITNGDGNIFQVFFSDVFHRTTRDSVTPSIPLASPLQRKGKQKTGEPGTCIKTLKIRTKVLSMLRDGRLAVSPSSVWSFGGLRPQPPTPRGHRSIPRGCKL